MLPRTGETGTSWARSAVVVYRSMLSVIVSTLLIVCAHPSGPAGPEPEVPAKSDADAADAPTATLSLDLLPAETHVLVHRAADDEVEASVFESGDRSLAPGTYWLATGRAVGREVRSKQRLHLEAGDVLHLRITTTRRIPLFIAGAVLATAGWGMLFAGMVRSTGRGSITQPRGDTRSGVLAGVGTGALLSGTPLLAFGLLPRVRICRERAGAAGVFPPCEDS